MHALFSYKCTRTDKGVVHNNVYFIDFHTARNNASRRYTNTEHNFIRHGSKLSE